MKLELSNWDNDLPTKPDEQYQALVRTLNLTDGFSLLFVRCSPAYGEQLITKCQQDVFQKHIDVLRLKQPIDNFYDLIENLPSKDAINILFVSGIEKSLVEYIKPGYGGEGDFYKLDTVPRILGHLNLQRERFRDDFNICFVFLLRLFGLKYFIHRAPDFFDWRSGLFEFGEEQVNVTVNIEKKLHERLKMKAKAESKPVSAVAAQAVALYLAHQEVEDE